MPKHRSCAYCGGSENMTKDHVIPLCLFVQPYPLNLITVPSCLKCNGEKSRNDDFLRDLLTTDIYGNQNPIAQQIFQDKVLSSARHGSSVVAQTMLSNSQPESFFSHGGIDLGIVQSAPVETEQIKDIFSTIVRGLYYYSRRKQMPSDYEFKVLRYHPPQFVQVCNQLHHQFRFQGPFVRGNIFGYSFFEAEDDSASSYWLLWFYDIVGISVSALKPEWAARDNIGIPPSFGRVR